MEMSRITLRNILLALFIGSIAAICGISSAKKEPIKVEQKIDIEEQKAISLIPPE